MILLLGGTSETAPLSTALAEAGHAVLVSTATDAPLELPGHPSVSRRCGRLDASTMTVLIRECGAQALVDATHPYAVEAHRHAQEAARAAGIPCLRWLRRETDLAQIEGVIDASGHDEAARMAFSFGRPVLLTVGSRNLTPYVREAVRTGLPVVARVLPLAESLEACQRAGLPEAGIIAARGPFSVEENRKAIRDTGAGALVTKDSGVEGGVPAKVKAANLEGCHVVLVRRPPTVVLCGFQSVDALLRALEYLLPPSRQSGVETVPGT
jgi:precorrin-6A/cobalt-precorrin-6A reductase